MGKTTFIVFEDLQFVVLHYSGPRKVVQVKSRILNIIKRKSLWDSVIPGFTIKSSWRFLTDEKEKNTDLGVFVAFFFSLLDLKMGFLKTNIFG